MCVSGDRNGGWTSKSDLAIMRDIPVYITLDSKYRHLSIIW